MEWKKFARGGAFGLLLIAIGGCYEYKAPPAATLGKPTPGVIGTRRMSFSMELPN
ncbi:MAG: hypothetical protein L6W00_25420 [Lentisphaeria bacterium]|nr:MAG: hypothetical protein L6W00_25420 [Lentisphaeria bacterium]